MTKYTLTAALAAIALSMPLAAHAQVRATPVAYAEEPPYPGQVFGEAPEMMMAPPGSVVIPAHYSWDAGRQNYVWIAAQVAQPPHPNAQWIGGHWVQTPTSWIWLEGRWN